jgi:hypothetical protein
MMKILAKHQAIPILAAEGLLTLAGCTHLGPQGLDGRPNRTRDARINRSRSRFMENLTSEIDIGTQRV